MGFTRVVVPAASSGASEANGSILPCRTLLEALEIALSLAPGSDLLGKKRTGKGTPRKRGKAAAMLHQEDDLDELDAQLDEDY